MKARIMGLVGMAVVVASLGIGAMGHTQGTVEAAGCSSGGYYSWASSAPPYVNGSRDPALFAAWAWDDCSTIPIAARPPKPVV